MLRENFLKIRKLVFALRSAIEKKMGKFPSFSRWLRISEVLSRKEKIILLIFFILFFVSSFFLGGTFYLKNTILAPARGGEYIEGIMGFPRFINPVLATTDVDRDLIEIIFSGLMKYDDRGEIVKDLAKEIEIKEEGKIYEVYLKENIFWHDGQKVTPDDIIFTINRIQDPEFKSPLRANWLGIEIEKISSKKGEGIRFKLSKPYAGFEARLTLKIIPRHIWQEISAQNFPLSIHNFQAVGSGPFLLKKIDRTQEGKILSLTLERFKRYYGKSPYLSQIFFRFFETEDQLVRAFNKKEILGLAPSYNLITKKNLELDQINEYLFLWPRYFALFFNPKKSEILNQKNVRRALNYATDKNEIVNSVFLDRAKVVDSPTLPDIFNLSPPKNIYLFDFEKAENLLKDSGFIKKEEKFVKIVGKQFPEFKSDLKLGSRNQEVKNLQSCLAQFPEIYPEGDITGYFGRLTEKAVVRFQEKYAEDILAPWGFKRGTGIVSKTTRKKLNEICGKPPEVVPLKFTLTTVEDPTLKEVASLVKKQWESLGIGVEIKTFPVSEIEQNVIKPRDYEILLFGEALGVIPDLFPFWHSTQTKDPGLNLTGFKSIKADELLEKIRINLDPEIRAKNLQDLQELLIEDAPAVFLCSPDYIYLVSKEIKGIKTQKLIADPSKRFSGIENWYIKTRRVFK